MSKVMRRAQAIFVVFMFAALPLVMLAQTGQAPACDGMCCVRHAAHAPGPHGTSQPEGMSCHHGTAIHIFECGMHSKQQHPQVALIAPLPPTMLSGLAALPLPAPNRQSLVQTTQIIFPGFLSIPFEPPRA
jgi:hypothetical protein